MWCYFILKIITEEEENTSLLKHNDESFMVNDKYKYF